MGVIDFEKRLSELEKKVSEISEDMDDLRAGNEEIRSFINKLKELNKLGGQRLKSIQLQIGIPNKLLELHVNLFKNSTFVFNQNRMFIN